MWYKQQVVERGRNLDEQCIVHQLDISSGYHVLRGWS